MDTPNPITLCKSLREARERNVNRPVVMVLSRGREAASAIWKFALQEYGWNAPSVVGTAHVIVTDPDGAKALWEAAKARVQNLSDLEPIPNRPVNSDRDAMWYVYVADTDARAMFENYKFINTAAVLEGLPLEILISLGDRWAQVWLRNLQAGGEEFPVQIIVNGDSEVFRGLAEKVKAPSRAVPLTDVVGVVENATARELLQEVPGVVQLLEDTSDGDPSTSYWVVIAEDDEIEVALMTPYLGTPVCVALAVRPAVTAPGALPMGL